MQLRSVCRQCLLIAVAAMPAVWPCASSAGDCILARGGRAEAVIVVGKGANPFHLWVAGELQRYLHELTGGQFSVVAELPVTDEVRARTTLIVLGGPNVNPLAAAAQKQRLVDFTGLKLEGFILKAVELAGRRMILVGGNDERGTMYAAYDLLERLGIVFQLTNDIIPQQKPDLALRSLYARIEPALKYRGMHCWQSYQWYMGLDEFRKQIDQLAKLKLNYLQFSMAINSVWLGFSYGGKQAEVASFKDSGYIGFDYPSISCQTGTIKDVRIGRECLRGERVALWSSPPFRRPRRPAPSPVSFSAKSSATPTSGRFGSV